MKKILFVATVQSHIMNFHIPYLKHWQNNGYEVHVATKMDKEKYKNLDNSISRVVWHDIDFSRNPISKNTIKALCQLVSLMHGTRYSLVHVHTPVGGIIGRLAAKITNTKNVVYTAHGFHFYEGAPLKNWVMYYPMEKIMAKCTDAIITMNEEDYELAKNKFKTRIKGNIFKVNGVGVDLGKYYMSDEKDIQFKKSLGLKEDDFVITVIAELIERKNHIQLINAMDIITKENPNVKALFVGDGKLYDYIEKEIRIRNLDNNITLLGFRKDIEKIINITDILGLFSYHEGLPKNIMEGMAAGKAVICTNIRGNRDLIKNKVNGITVEINNIQETVDSIRYCLNNINIIDEYGKKSKLLIKNYDVNYVLEYVDKNIYNKFKLG